MIEYWIWIPWLQNLGKSSGRTSCINWITLANFYAIYFVSMAILAEGGGEGHWLLPLPWLRKKLPLKQWRGQVTLTEFVMLRQVLAQSGEMGVPDDEEVLAQIWSQNFSSLRSRQSSSPSHTYSVGIHLLLSHLKSITSHSGYSVEWIRLNKVMFKIGSTC